MALGADEIPVVNWFTGDPELEALAKTMAQGAQYTQQYRQKAADARAKGTGNRLAAFAPANNVLTQLMGGQQQFDLGAFANNNPLPDMISPFGMGGGQTTPVDPTQQGLYASGENGEQALTPQDREQLALQSVVKDKPSFGTEAGRVIQQTVNNPFISPVGPLPWLIPGMGGQETASATYYGDLRGKQAFRGAELEGYQPGVTVAPPGWDRSGVIWDPANTPLRWDRLNPQQQAMAIERGEYTQYEGAPTPEEVNYQPTLSEEEFNRLMSEGG